MVKPLLTFRKGIYKNYFGRNNVTVSHQQTK
jgi:hypothetical protein